MKKLLMLFVLVFGVVSFAQEKKVNVEQKGDIYHATYFHDNGEIAQQGYFNASGKLHGTWVNFDSEGNKISLGNFDNGKKVGKWLFWSADKLTEIDYRNFKINEVNQWNNKTMIAISK
ncbi:MAG: toxin-antitoxin system YwqK family antitoxin [Flavobacteriaceae bacterium]